MSFYEAFIKKAVEHPEWEKIRVELCGRPEDQPEPEIIELGKGIRMWKGEGFSSQKEADDHELFGSLCWYINGGPPECREAPPSIQKLLRRLDLYD